MRGLAGLGNRLGRAAHDEVADGFDGVIEGAADRFQAVDERLNRLARFVGGFAGVFELPNPFLHRPQAGIGSGQLHPAGGGGGVVIAIQIAEGLDGEIALRGGFFGGVLDLPDDGIDTAQGRVHGGGLQLAGKDFRLRLQAHGREGF